MKNDIVAQAKAFLEGALNTPSSLLLVGDLALDRFIFGSVDRISPEAPVPVLLVDREEDQPGCAANVARSLAELFTQVPRAKLSMHGVLGNDQTGERLVQRLKVLSPHQISLHLHLDAERPTPLKTRYLAGSQRSQQQLLRVDVESTRPLAAHSLKLVENDLFAALPATTILIVQDYAKGVFEAGFLQRLLGAAQEQGVRTLVDPNRNTPAEAYKNAWMITPNVEEAERLLGRSLNKGIDDNECAQACLDLKRKLNVKIGVLTRSRYGVSVADENDRVFHVPALARAVSDVTGAGDTLVAVLALSLGMGASLELAAELANAAASVVVGKVGTATASWQEIQEELAHRILL